MVERVRVGVLWSQLVLLNGVVAAARRVREALSRPLDDARGQTPTEYLMIVGLMAVVIVVAFTMYFWPKVQPAAQQWSQNVRESIFGNQIKP
jgi:Flp pilus assembly pilin Flp